MTNEQVTKRHTTQNIILLLIAVVVLLLLLHACERRTTTGPDSGSATKTTAGVPEGFSATNATSNGAIVLRSAFAGLMPGKTVPVHFRVDNSAGSSRQIGTITSVISFDAGHRGCRAADFTAAPVTANRTIAARSSGVALPAGSIAFADTAQNQDACKGATLTLTSTWVSTSSTPDTTAAPKP
jgi:hypothetical protein